MILIRAARAALACQTGARRILAAGPIAVILFLVGFSLSCGSSGRLTRQDHNAYVTLPGKGSVALLHINGTTGAISVGAETPQVIGTTPTALALLPSKKFLYAVNSLDNTISIFSVALDGTLNLTGSPIPVGGTGPVAAAIDPTGQYLLVTNAFTDNISVFSIDAGTGALSLVGSPVPANSNPSEILFTHSGKFVYITNPSLGQVTGFSFSNGVLVPVPNSPVLSGLGAFGLAVDSSDRFLYVANPSDPNPVVPTIGNISGFTIDPGSGQLTTILGSPFTVSNGTGPTVIAVDPNGRFVYAITTGTSNSLWGFQINATNGKLVPITGSPFSLTGGSVFVLIDPDGDYLYIGSEQSNGIAAYTYDPSTGVPKAIVSSPFSTGTTPGGMVLSE